jgi:hypothetical protein
MKKLLSLTRSYPLEPRINQSEGIKKLTADANGCRCDRPKLVLEICTKYGNICCGDFIFDTGADMMMIPCHLAHRHGIEYTKNYPGTTTSPGGVAPCFYDYVSIQSSLSGKLYRWPCCFVETRIDRMLVGRAGLLDEFGVFIKDGWIIVSYPVPFWRFLVDRCKKFRAWLTGGRRRSDLEPI